MQTPNQPKTTPKKEEQPKKPEQQKPEQQTKGGNKHDPKLPTPDHIAAKENAEVPPNDETMSDQQDAYRLPENSGGGQRLDTNTMSDQPGPTRGKGE